MLNTIETRLSDAQGLLSLVAHEYQHGEKEHAAEELDEVLARLLVLCREIKAELEPPADDALRFGCGHCGHECPVSELNAGKCPKCGTVKDGVLVVPKVDRWREREEAPLRKPQGHAVKVQNSNGEFWMV